MCTVPSTRVCARKTNVAWSYKFYRAVLVYCLMNGSLETAEWSWPEGGSFVL